MLAWSLLGTIGIVLATPALAREGAPAPALPATASQVAAVSIAPDIVMGRANALTIPRASSLAPQSSRAHPQIVTLPMSTAHMPPLTRMTAEPLGYVTGREQFPRFAATFEPVERECVRALRLDPPRRGGKGPLDTRLTLRLNGDGDADWNVKGGVAGMLKHAIDE